ncbi:hypothetical protein WH297_05910 [Ochrobactrum vermis]|uniref:Uncharacterized protein n=1 Tax=Ochrobactrum vermis TaxID=1827297 RepID=A0ABU8PAJ3_9HYPH|nr:hypothetical protein [Ochrobactrum vermis]PQZ29768.1 hypothetical protein CQZ93_06045 [Ochrobactrum vermis]
MTNEIINTHDLAEQEWDGHTEPQDVDTDMVATKEAEGKGIEFHVSMRDYTMRDMETLIIEAAAMQIVGKFGDARLAKEIEAKAIALVTAKADKALDAVTTEIIDQPLTPSFGDKKPVTMREFIGLTGREYLAETVDRDGKPAKRDAWGGTTYTRMELLAFKFMERKFKDEIEKATNAAVREIQTAINTKHAEFLKAEKARIREAIDKLAS